MKILPDTPSFILDIGDNVELSITEGGAGIIYISPQTTGSVVVETLGADSNWHPRVTTTYLRIRMAIPQKKETQNATAHTG